MTDGYDFFSIATDVHMYKEHIRFFDTNRGHMIVGGLTYEDEHGFKFISKGHASGVWEFKCDLLLRRQTLYPIRI